MLRVCHHGAAVRALFWIPVALLTWTQVGYGLFLAALRRAGRRRGRRRLRARTGRGSRW